MLVETGKMLFAAFDGAMFLDHAVAVLGRREHRAHGHPGLVAFSCERHRGLEAHRLKILIAAVPVDEALRRHDFEIGDLVLIVAAVRPVHDEAPHAAWLHLHLVRGRGEAAGSPPFPTCSGSVQASNTSSCGASISRDRTISRSVGILASAVMASMPLPFLLLRLHFAEINLQAIETFVPQRPVALEPRVDVLQRVGRDAAGAPLRLAAPGDEAGALQHLEVLGDGGAAHLEGLGELRHGGLAKRKPGENGAPGRVGKGCESGTELVGGHLYITYRLDNRSVKYAARVVE